ncbi:MAG: phospho-N-acetylmuramoyl-pentapeptide-transferase [candidate division WOR-3 bacterium]
MFYELFYPLTPHFSPFNLFQYITFRAAMAALTSGFLVMAVLPWFIRRRILPERISEDVPREHTHKEGIPSSGGIVILMGVLISSILWARPQPLVWIALFSVAYMGIVGLADDLIKRKGDKKKGLSKWWKLLLQFILSVLVVFGLAWAYPQGAFLVQMPFAKNLLINIGYFYALFATLLFVWTTNSVNLTDGLDGLAAGAAMPVFAALGAIAYAAGHIKLSSYLAIIYIPGAGELTVISACVLGALLGFLWFNAHPARVFMGDTGSQAIGAAMAIIAILSKHELVMIIAGGLFMAEALSVAIQVGYFRLTKGKRVFLCAPLHHHYEYKGWKESTIVTRFWIISILCSLFALSTLKIR